MKNLLNRKHISFYKVITNPFSSFEDIKEKQLGAWWQIVIPVICFFVVRIFSLVFGGFLFNYTKINDVNLFVEFATVIGIYLLFVFANKNFCDLSDGDGNYIEVALSVSFALIPYTITQLLNIVLSNFFVIREAAFMSIITVVGLIWSLFVGLVGLISVHRYSFGKTVLTVIITIIFMALIAFLIALIFIITQQMYLFFKDIYNELVFRM